MGAALGRLARRDLAAEIAYIRASIIGGVRVQDFLVKAGLRGADAVALTNNGRGVEDDEEQVFGLFSVAGEGENAVVGVVGVQPLETLPNKINLMQSGLGGEKLIQVANEVLDAAMRIVLEQVPIELVASLHSLRWASSWPMKRSFLPG